MEYVTLILSAVAAAAAVAALIVAVCKKSVSENKLKEILRERAEVDETIRNNQNVAITRLQDAVIAMSNQMDTSYKNFSDATTKQLDSIKTTNEQKLAEIKGVVDEKLKTTIKDRFDETFKTLSDQFKTMQTGFGEMKELVDSNVGDLKRVMANSKAIGNLGEIQLESILADVLPPAFWERQYVLSARSEKNNEKVDFVLKIPGKDDSQVLLPIDSKFPTESYKHLLEAMDAGNREEILKARADFETDIKKVAKSISSKYIQPPITTDYAVMFLPSEGLYSEAAKSSLVETLMHDYKVLITGPSTTAALINSVNLVLRTSELEKRSDEVWKTLGAVKKEFEKFNAGLKDAQRNINLAGTNIDALITTRTNKIQSALRNVAVISEGEATAILNSAEEVPLPDSTEI